MRKLLFLLSFCAVMAFSLAPVQAAIIQAGGSIGIFANIPDSESGLGNFTATLTYFIDTTNSSFGRLVVDDLTNTSPLANGGFITAFVMNDPGPIVSITSFSSTNANFAQLGLSDDGINGQPFGLFDFGASTGDGFQGGGSPNGGIGVGASADFTFDFTGTNLNLLTAQSFVDTLSAPQGTDKLQFFVARFRGFVDEGSDKVPAFVPIPGAVLLLGAGFARLLAYARRRQE